MAARTVAREVFENTYGATVASSVTRVESVERDFWIKPIFKDTWTSIKAKSHLFASHVARAFIGRQTAQNMKEFFIRKLWCTCNCGIMYMFLWTLFMQLLFTMLRDNRWCIGTCSLAVFVLNMHGLPTLHYFIFILLYIVKLRLFLSWLGLCQLTCHADRL